MYRHLTRFVSGLSTALLIGLSPNLLQANENSALELVGLWEAKRNLGPEIQGSLTITQTNDTLKAEIAGFKAEARHKTGEIKLEIPGNRGSFRGRFQSGRQTIVGYWTQPGIAFLGSRFASPVTLEKLATNRWRGQVVPVNDTIGLHLVVEEHDDGTVDAFIRNPEFNIGVFMSIDRVEKKSDRVRLLGRYRGSDEEQQLAEGTYSQETGLLSLLFPFVNSVGSYDFVRVEDDVLNPFYPRGASPEKYAYQPPQDENDGWLTSSLKQEGISFERITEFVQMLIDTTTESVESSDIHGVLIARHGKLVLEEYFHGFHGENPHDTRSASKSLASVLVGAAIADGMPIKATDSVWETIYGSELPEDLDPRKRRISIEHLLTMSSGIGCDDWNSPLPGEGEMQSQTDQPDWHQYILDLPMAREPGEEAAYCAGALNLVGRVLESVSEVTLPELIHRLIARPLQIDRYHLNLTSSGHAYLGGGIHWLPRDFMKLGQVILDDGEWNGKRVFSKEWAQKTITSHYELGTEAEYGYTWWVCSYPYKGRTVQAFFAGGNGGQIVMGFPELDLLLAFYGGNYNSRTLFKAQREFVPNYILPAVEDSP
ncbi:MAG: serine hydrolase [bacterium]|nr:serine hydrolase [bacterium]